VRLFYIFSISQQEAVLATDRFEINILVQNNIERKGNWVSRKKIMNMKYKFHDICPASNYIVKQSLYTPWRRLGGEEI
jgi:hypothetical protein